ncbi:GPI-anchored protein LLG1-like [Vicia villosa]|uniref:GPI-anchored protein LLG1-like n=1 Tax=Vicia villosa TaxID=3911 RepID=UPI00273C3D87|nr:GPI-anchored protein LLG1-like [Vicia villosa]XP_058773306.1 GPI-anchored protein LLG1-like [Vicia villosa]
MAFSTCFCYFKVAYAFFSSFLYFFLLMTLATSSPFLSDDIFESNTFTGRALLQTMKACEVDFEHQNYTIIISQCKGPRYPRRACCEAFKEFACPFADEINDLTTNCATIMFSYIKANGKYPPGLFAHECREGQKGLDCSLVKIANSSNISSSVHVAAPHPMLLISIIGFLGFTF